MLEKYCFLYTGVYMERFFSCSSSVLSLHDSGIYCFRCQSSSFFFLIGRLYRKSGEKEKNKETDFLSTGSQQLELCRFEMQEPKALGYPLLNSQVVSRELDQTEAAATRTYTHMECQHQLVED